jgi:hypothetical protein
LGGRGASNLATANFTTPSILWHFFKKFNFFSSVVPIVTINSHTFKNFIQQCKHNTDLQTLVFLPNPVILSQKQQRYRCDSKTPGGGNKNVPINVGELQLTE